MFSDDGDDDGVYVAVKDEGELPLVETPDGEEDPEREVEDNGDGPGSHHWADRSIRPETR